MVSSLAAAGARGGFMTVSGQLLALVVRLVGLVVLGRLIEPYLFGLAAIVASIATFVGALIYLGLPMATAQARHLSSRAQSSLFVLNLAMGAVLAFGLFVAAEPIAGLYGHPELALLIQWLAVVPLLGGAQSQFRLRMLRDLRFTALALADVAAQVAGTGAAILLAVLGQPVAAVISQSLVQSAVLVVLAVSCARWRPGAPGAWREEVFPILRIGLHILGSTVLRDGSKNILIPVMAFSQSPTQIGNFDRAQQLAIVPVSLTVDQMQRVAVPVLSQLRDAPERMLTYMRSAQLVASYLTASAFFLGAVLGGYAVRVILGEDWTLAGTVVQVLCVGAVFRTLGQAMQWIYIAAGATAVGLRFNLWSQPAVAIISLCGLPWGVVGVAAANSLAWVLLWPASVSLASRAAGFSATPLIADALRAVTLFGLPTTLAAAWVWFVPMGPGAALGAGLLTSTLVGGTLILFVRPVRRDLTQLRSIVRLARRR